MLRSLSYFNIFCAVLYFLMFLMEGSYLVILGTLVVVLFNFMVIRTVQQEERFGIIHHLLGVCTLGFAGFLSYGLYHIVQSSYEHHYFGNTWLYISLSSVFVLGMLVHLVKYTF